MKYIVKKLLYVPEYRSIFGRENSTVFYLEDGYEWLYFTKNIRDLIFHGDIITQWNDKNELIIEGTSGCKLEVEVIEKADKLVIATRRNKCK